MFRPPQIEIEKVLEARESSGEDMSDFFDDVLRKYEADLSILSQMENSVLFAFGENQSKYDELLEFRADFTQEC